MLIQELGALLTLLIGATLGIVGFVILCFWLSLIFKCFDDESKFFWPLFWINQIVWMVGTCIIPYDWLNDNVELWGWPFMIYFLGSMIIRAIVILSGKK
jgi:hypothetical protein